MQFLVASHPFNQTEIWFSNKDTQPIKTTFKSSLNFQLRQSHHPSPLGFESIKDTIHIRESNQVQPGLFKTVATNALLQSACFGQKIRFLLLLTLIFFHIHNPVPCWKRIFLEMTQMTQVTTWWKTRWGICRGMKKIMGLVTQLEDSWMPCGVRGS